MAYEIIFDSRIKHDIRRVHPQESERIRKRIQELQYYPEIGKRLIGSDIWSLRIGQYRVLYRIRRAEQRVFVIEISHRKNAYDR